MGGAVRRHGVLGALYLTQGIAAGFGGYILIPNLAAQGISVEAQAGVVAGGSIPWILKGAFGPLLDRAREGGARDLRRVAMFVQLLVAASLVVLAASGDVVGHFSWLVWAWLLHNFMLAIQDVTADALAIDMLPPSERGLGNGVMLGGRQLGVDVLVPRLLGVGVIVSSLEAALWLEAALIGGLAFLPLLAPWSPGEHAEALRAPLLDRLRAAFAGRRTRAAAAVAGVVFLADVVTSTLTGEFMVNHLGWEPEAIGLRLGMPNLIFALSGYALATMVADRLGHARTAAAGSVGLGATWIVFALLEAHWGTPDTVVTMVCAQALFTALLYVGIHAALMDHTDPAVRATQFVIFMGLLNLPRLYGAAVAPGLLASLGFSGLWLACGGYQVAMALLLPRLGTDDD